MGRDKTGKNQEEANLKLKQEQEAKDRAKRETAVAKENAAVDKLEANPGLGTEYMAGARARNAGVIGGAFADAEDQARRNAAQTGHYADDAGLYPQQKEMAREKARMETGADMDYNLKDAEASLDTRRMIPGMLSGVPNIYNSSAGNLAGNQTSLINSRMEQDSKPGILAQLALAGIQGTGAAAIGKIPRGGSSGNS